MTRKTIRISILEIIKKRRLPFRKTKVWPPDDYKKKYNRQKEKRIKEE